jgi:hypothetical protein
MTTYTSTIHVAGAKPMMRSGGERRPNLAKAVAAATIAVIAAPAKHTKTTRMKLPKLPGPCSPGSPRPLLQRRNIQAEKKNSQAAENQRIRTRPGEYDCCEEGFMGGTSP